MSSYAFADETDQPRITPAVSWLLWINVGIFFLQVVGPFQAADVQGTLGFAMPDLARAPWKALTYMFAHRDLMHVGFNMLSLWIFGTRLEHAWRVESRKGPAAGSQSFAYFFLWCGLGGWLAHVLFVRSGLLIGASAAIYGVMYAYARRWPDTEFLLFFAVPVKMKYLFAGYVAWDLLNGVLFPGGSVAHLAHLGGFAFAYLWFLPARGGLDRLRERMTPAADVPDETPRAVPPRPRSLPRERGSEIEEIIARSKAAVAKREPRVPARPPLALVSTTRKEQLDLVLDKISEKGLDSLTAEERRLLEEMSKKLRSETT